MLAAASGAGSANPDAPTIDAARVYKANQCDVCGDSFPAAPWVANCKDGNIYKFKCIDRLRGSPTLVAPWLSDIPTTLGLTLTCVYCWLEANQDEPRERYLQGLNGPPTDRWQRMAEESKWYMTAPSLQAMPEPYGACRLLAGQTKIRD